MLNDDVKFNKKSQSAAFTLYVSYTILSKCNLKRLLLYSSILLFALQLQIIFIDYSDAHKLLEGPAVSNDNTMFESALMIPNHTVSWAIYQQLDGQDNVDARFYKFNNSQPKSNFYASIVIPKINEYTNFTPSLSLIGPVLENNKGKNANDEPVKGIDTVNQSNIPIESTSSNISEGEKKDRKVPFNVSADYKIILNSSYEGPIPSPVFYEEFTQTSYWERQEIRTILNETGMHYLVVYNNHIDNTDKGKYSLAVGEIEDFAPQDFFILLPYSWVKVKLFFNDYSSVFIVSFVFLFLFVILPLLVIIKRRRKRGKKKS